MIRIANGQGFWGDWLEAPVRLVEQGPIDYLTLDYLAEVTMSILQKQKQADPNLGYARDFPPLIGAHRARHRASAASRVIANAGGVNPVACAREVVRLAPGLQGGGGAGRRRAIRGSTNSSPKGYEMRDMDTGEPLAAIRDRILSANAYIGAFPLAEALATGARRGDRRALHRYRAGAGADGPPLRLEAATIATSWRAGTIAGHIIECGAQCTGGNCQVDWQNIPDLANDRLPDRGGGAGRHVRGHEARRHRRARQLAFGQGAAALRNRRSDALHHAGLRRRFHQRAAGRRRRRPRAGERRARRPAPAIAEALDQLRERAGRRSARWCIRGRRRWRRRGRRIASCGQRLAKLGLAFEEIYTEFFGVNACHGPAAPPNPDPPEVQLAHRRARAGQARRWTASRAN